MRQAPRAWEEILAVIAYLQSMGGEVTVDLESTVWPLGEGDAGDQEG